MDPRDDDIQFDFFDEPATSEAPQGSRMKLPQRAGRGSGGPVVPRAAAPLVRLLLLVFFVIFLVLVFSLLVQSCTSQSRHSLYSSYMTKVGLIANQSTQDGKRTLDALTSSGLKVADIVAKLDGVARAEQLNIDAAEKIVPPGRLRSEHASLIESLQLRKSGVEGLSKAFDAMNGSKASSSEEATILAGQAYRLLASDVVWDDLFATLAANQLTNDGVSGVTPPESHFLANPDLVITQTAMKSLVERISGATTTGGTCDPSALHGSELLSVVALPKGVGGTAETLTPGGTLNTVTTSSSLVFQVTIKDSGSFQEVRIPISLVIDRLQTEGGPISKKRTVLLIDAGTEASVIFGDLGQVPFARQTTVTVTVGKVRCETNTANNSASYKVIFSLPS